jgi:hypothetical protein
VDREREWDGRQDVRGAGESGSSEGGERSKRERGAHITHKSASSLVLRLLAWTR